MVKNIDDLNIAKDILFNENLNICIVKDKKVIFKSDKRGIYPMYIAVTQHYDELNGASVADRVIGRAAAMLNVYSKTSDVYSDISSASAIEILSANDVNITYGESVPYIKNRTKDDYCPIEKISSKLAVDEYSKLVEKIKEFLVSIKAM